VDQPPITLCVITLNEERSIERCLRSAPFARDIVVLDSGSTDRTVEIARALGARVFVEPFRGHVLQKARAVELAAHDWVLCLDADESLSAELARAAPSALARDRGACVGYELARHTFYLGRYIDHGGWWPEWRLRLFDRTQGGWTGIDPHDRVEVRGRVQRLPGEIEHFAYRDLSHHLAKVNSYTTLMASRRFEAGERFRYRKLVLHPFGRFLRMFFVRQGFRDGWRGFLLAVIGAFYVFLKYAKLLELERGKPGPR
jgi:glycosyltransferase involved in cell wall biosynthesis